MQELIPRTSLERAYLQASCWTQYRSWRRGTLDLSRGEIGLAAAKYLAMIRMSMREKDYGSVVDNLGIVEQYGEWLTSAEKESLVRILCSLVLDIQDPESVESITLRRSVVMTAVHIIAQFSGDRAAVSDALSDLRHSTQVDLITERALLAQTKHLKKQLGRAINLIKEIGKVPASRSCTITGKIHSKDLQTRRADLLEKHIQATLSGIEKLSGNEVVLASLSELGYCLDILRIDCAMAPLERCSEHIERAFSACAARMRTRNSNCDEDERNRLGLVPQLEPLTETDRSNIVCHPGMGRERLAISKRHLLTKLSLYTLLFDSTRACSELNNFLVVFEQFGAIMGAETALFRQFCADQLSNFQKSDVKTNKGAVCSLFVNAIFLAAENFALGQKDLGILMLQSILDRFSVYGREPSFVAAIWEAAIVDLVDHYPSLAQQFFSPLVMMTELERQENDLLADAWYEAVFRKLLQGFDRAIANEFLQLCIIAREHVHGKNNSSLINLLLSQVEVFAAAGRLEDCHSTCELICEIAERETVDFEKEKSNVPILQALLQIAWYQRGASSPAVSRTYDAIVAAYKSCTGENVDTFVINSICTFIASDEANLDSFEPLIEFLTTFSADALIRTVDLHFDVQHYDAREEAFAFLLRLADFKNHDLYLELISRLKDKARFYLQGNEVCGAQAIYSVIASQDTDKLADSSLKTVVKIDLAYLLCKEKQLSKAIKLLNGLCPLPPGIMDTKRIAQISSIVMDCLRVGFVNDACSIMPALLSPDVLSDPSTITHTLGTLLMALLRGNNAALAEQVLRDAIDNCSQTIELWTSLLLSLSQSGEIENLSRLLPQHLQYQYPAYPLLRRLQARIELTEEN